MYIASVIKADKNNHHFKKVMENTITDICISPDNNDLFVSDKMGF